MSAHRKLGSPGVRVAIPVAVIALAAAACGSSSSAKTTPAAAATNAPAATGTPSSSVTLDTKSGPAGTYLTDASGKSLYEFASDTGSKSTCTGACVTAWPPLTSSSAVTAGSGVNAGDIGTLTRSDGSMQVTYKSHPLYYFSGDSSAGQTNGQGSTAFGAKWWLLTPAGAPITTSAGSSSSSSSGGMGYGY
jgi:predicted lipoprotein with Yx(FWY)xxD motif